VGLKVVEKKEKKKRAAKKWLNDLTTNKLVVFHP
jgi:hypothetical protein